MLVASVMVGGVELEEVDPCLGESFLLRSLLKKLCDSELVAES